MRVRVCVCVTPCSDPSMHQSEVSQAHCVCQRSDDGRTADCGGQKTTHHRVVRRKGWQFREGAADELFPSFPDAPETKVKMDLQLGDKPE